MISTENQPKCITTSDEDFTEVHYRLLLRMAKANYSFVTYDSIPWGTRFILWRHDLDYSINRAATLASIEAEEGVTATYFVNPRSEFHNPFEPDQSRLVKHILGLGHRLGLHFDANCNGIQEEDQLNHRVMQEMRWLEDAFDVRPVVFSFHNPGAAQLQCDADCYGGAINTYSRRFKTEIPYCSDSNGYWRFRRLYDVLEDATAPCLQVLTHPGWWQEISLPPRQRIFRSVYGRANATMQFYDRSLADGGRENLIGRSKAINFLKSTNPKLWHLTDYLWNSGCIDTLFVELWLLHESQINRLCKAVFRKEWKVAAGEVNEFFRRPDLTIDCRRLFGLVFDKSWKHVTATDEGIYSDLVQMRNQLFHGRNSAPNEKLEQGCVTLCKIVESLANWGTSQSIRYDGISHLGTIGIPTFKTVDGKLNDRLDESADDTAGYPVERWERFKDDILNP